MPVLPSGRRIEFTLDRFKALLGQLQIDHATTIASALSDPDDLLPVLDAVHFSHQSGTPFFADYVAADWEVAATDWNAEDREALRRWFGSDAARYYRAEAIKHIKQLVDRLAAQHGESLPANSDDRHASATPCRRSGTAILSRQAARIATEQPSHRTISAETGTSLDLSHISVAMARRLH